MKLDGRATIKDTIDRYGHAYVTKSALGDVLRIEPDYPGNSLGVYKVTRRDGDLDWCPCA